MFTEMRKRRYRQGRRAARAEETRQRIVEAAVQLHEELGPASTTISAIAKLAGVQRLTVYRHFPDEKAIFAACTSHFMTLNPPPQIEQWEDVDGAIPRAAAALSKVYAYYRRTQGMLHKAYRDIELAPALVEPFAELQAWLDGVCEDLLSKWKGRRRKDVEAVIRHVTGFPAWESLISTGLSDKRAVEVVEKWLGAL
jgi:AcrR family transcriptional regulator